MQTPGCADTGVLSYREGLENLYGLSYLWFSALGILMTVLVGLVVSVATGGHCAESSHLLSAYLLSSLSTLSLSTLQPVYSPACLLSSISTLSLSTLHPINSICSLAYLLYLLSSLYTSNLATLQPVSPIHSAVYLLSSLSTVSNLQPIVCVCACVRACVRARACACVCACVCERAVDGGFDVEYKNWPSFLLKFH